MVRNDIEDIFYLKENLFISFSSLFSFSFSFSFSSLFNRQKKKHKRNKKGHKQTKRTKGTSKTMQRRENTALVLFFLWGLVALSCSDGTRVFSNPTTTLQQEGFDSLIAPLVDSENYSKGESEEERTVQILRFNVEIRVSLDASVRTLQDLVQIARDRFHDQTISKLLSRTGDPISSLESLERLPIREESTISVIAKSDKESFMWSAWKVGEDVPILLDGGRREVVVRTLATQPRLFEVDNLIDPSECDHIIKRALELGLKRSPVGETAEVARLSKGRTRYV